MSLLLLFAFMCHLLAILTTLGFGLTYLLRRQFMPYHGVALEREWDALPYALQTLILALMRAVAGGALATALLSMLTPSGDNFQVNKASAAYMGNFINIGFEKVLLMQNPVNTGVSEIIDTYVYKVGLASTALDFSYATAIGLFKGVIALILVFTANWAVKRMGQEGLW